MIKRKTIVRLGMGSAFVLICTGALLFFARQHMSEPVTEPANEMQADREVIGKSVDGGEIEAFHFGSGETRVVFVGGIHGGYEWNTVALAYRVIDYLRHDPGRIPDSVTVSIIPAANPDGVYAVLGTTGRIDVRDMPSKGRDTSEGRFNARSVDLNRNFPCNWMPEAVWKGKTVSAGSAPFSEPETRAIRDFVNVRKPAAVVFWHSMANAVYASECKDGILPGTRAIMEAYANASGYRAFDTFDAYRVTGDAEGWLASLGIPAITVELASHDDLEWEKNRRGVEAVFDYYRAR